MRSEVMLVKNAQKLCAALTLGMTMAIASQPSALAFGSYEECRNVFGPIPFCLNFLDFEESSDNSADSSTGDESGQSVSGVGSDEISESPDNSANSPTADELGQSISGVEPGDATEMVSVPEPSLIVGVIAVGGLMLGSRKKAKA
jgi:hypothetical protein